MSNLSGRLDRLEREAGPQEPAPQAGWSYEELRALPVATLHLLCVRALGDPGDDYEELRKLSLDELHRLYCEALEECKLGRGEGGPEA
jgi:hypothetical protein